MSHHAVILTAGFCNNKQNKNMFSSYFCSRRKLLVHFPPLSTILRIYVLISCLLRRVDLFQHFFDNYTESHKGALRYIVITPIEQQPYQKLASLCTKSKRIHPSNNPNETKVKKVNNVDS